MSALNPKSPIPFMDTTASGLGLDEAVYTRVVGYAHISPTKGGLEVCVFIFSFTFLDAALATKTMCTQNLVHILL